MTLEDEYTRTVSVQRLAPSAGNGNTEEYADHIDAVACHIQPLDDTYTADIEGNFGKDSLLFCAVQDILETDRVIDEDEIAWRVVAVESFDFLGVPRHMELRIRRFNP